MHVISENKMASIIAEAALEATLGVVVREEWLCTGSCFGSDMSFEWSTLRAFVET